MPVLAAVERRPAARHGKGRRASSSLKQPQRDCVWVWVWVCVSVYVDVGACCVCVALCGF